MTIAVIKNKRSQILLRRTDFARREIQVITGLSGTVSDGSAQVLFGELSAATRLEGDLADESVTLLGDLALDSELRADLYDGSELDASMKGDC